MSSKSILLVMICVSILALASTTLENSAINGKEEDIFRRRRDIYSDQYEDEDGVMNDGMVRRSLASMDLEGLKSQVSRPSRRNFNGLHRRNNYSVKKNLNERRTLTSLDGNVNRNVNVNVNKFNVSSGSAIQIPLSNQTSDSEATVEIDGYPPNTREINQIPKNIIITFLISHQLRENLLYIFGCLLQRSADFLTEPQYTALHIIYVELRNRPSRIHSVLKDLKNVTSSNLNDQMKSIMEIFGHVLPPYIACAALFWVREIQHNRINLNNLPRNACSKDFNILEDVNVQAIKLQEVMIPIDAPTRMTQYILGKVFVSILHDVQKLKVTLSQEMFGIILSNFPLIPYDPVLDEYIRFILEVTMKGKIPSWQDIELEQVIGEPYRFIKIIIGQILVLPNVPRSIKEALAYIRIHLRPVPSTYVNPDYQIMHKLNVRTLDIELLFSFIVPNVYSKETICLKDRFLQYIREHHLSHSWVLSEMDRLRYINPHDLLLAYLAKLQRHIPKQDGDLGRIVTALLSVLIIDKQNKQFSPATKNIEILALLGYLASPDFVPKVNVIYDKAITALVSHPDLQHAITKLVPVEKGKCIAIDECLKEILQNLEQLNLDIPRRMEKIINELIAIIPAQTINPNCKAIFISNNTFINIATDTPSVKEIVEITEGNSGFSNRLIDSGNSHLIESGSGSGIKIPGNNHLFVGKIDMVNVLMLPPTMSATQQITIYINSKGVPVVDAPNSQSDLGNPKVTLPSVVVILMPPEISDPFGSMNPEFKGQILDPIIKIAGSSDLTLILGSSVSDFINSGQCPTLAALLVHLLEQAKSNPKVQANRQLLFAIKTYLSGLDLLAVIVLPVVMRVAKINPINSILFSIISISEPGTSRISLTPPSNIPEGSLVFVIVDPNKLREPVDPQNPFEGLLPNVRSNTPGGNYVQELKVFFSRKKIAEFFPNFKPEEYMSKGFLLMVILQKLPNVPEIARKPRLKKIIIGYIWAILIPAFFTKVPYTDVIAELGKQPRVKPDTAILIQLLPQPQNEKENAFFIKMQHLLEMPDLFSLLLLPKPTPNTNQNELLKMIIIAVINSVGKFDSETVMACKFYNKKIFDIEKGSLPLIWEIEKPVLNIFEVQLGDVIENVVNYDDLSDENKKAYNDLLAYLRENSVIFTLMKEFSFKQYKTEGTFLKGLFKFLLEKQIISQSAKTNIKAILPHVMLNGPGAKPLKTTKKGKSVNGRRTGSQLEINI